MLEIRTRDRSRRTFVVVSVATACLAALVLAIFLTTGAPHAPPRAATAESGPDAAAHRVWTHFAGDAGAMQYSGIDQITPQNVNRLQVAWTYRTGELMRHPATANHSAFAATPIVAGGSIIFCTPWDRVIALDPVTGRERWVFDPAGRIDASQGMKMVCRGVSAWTDPAAAAGAPCKERIIFGTADLRVIALDARDGKPCPGFGENGQVQVQVALRIGGELRFNAPPAIVNGVAIFGSAVMDGYQSHRPRGTVRAFDARTGALRWTFDPVPQDSSDPAWTTWLNNSAKDYGGANVWADMSADEARDLVFLPTSSAAVDTYGGLRPGDNRYANSVVALKASTGKIVWHQQIVHHDIWDYDLPTAPILMDLTIKGKKTPAVVQLTKMGMIFVYHRETGAPLFSIEERPVPASKVPGERTSPTQPFTVTMPDLMPQKLDVKDAWGFTPFDRHACQQRIKDWGGDSKIYDPPSRTGWVLFPLWAGGTDLGMRAYDPTRHLLIANINRAAAGMRMVPPPTATHKVVGIPADSPYLGDSPYLATVPSVLLSPLKAPCVAPPWGQLVAVDLEKQKIVWKEPLGSIEKLAPVPIPLRLGTPNRGGPLVTGSGVTIIAATMDQAIRGFDTATGKELWKALLPAGGQATPMTYMVGGRQYVVICVGGHDALHTKLGDYVMAYALPAKETRASADDHRRSTPRSPPTALSAATDWWAHVFGDRRRG